MSTINWAGVAVGAAVGIATGATTMTLLGRTQDKADASEASRATQDRLEAQRATVQQQLDAGTKAGTITVREQRDLERQIRELDAQIGEVDTGSRLLSENWPLIPGLALGGGLGITASKLNDKLNWSYKEVMLRPGSQFDFVGAPIGRGPKYGMVKDAPIGQAFLPSFVGGAAAGLLAGMVGARIVQQFTNQPS